MAITYCAIFCYLLLIGVDNPALSAIVPAIGFNLSTWSLSFVKEVWVRYHMSRDAAAREQTIIDMA